MSLYYSIPNVIPRIVAAVGIAVFGYVRYPYAAWLWAVVGIVVFGVVITTRRIDLDKNTLTLVPLLPIFRKQRLPLDKVGAFREYGSGLLSSVQADLDFGTGYRYAWFYPTNTLRVACSFGSSHGSRSLTAKQFSLAVDAYRRTAVALPTASGVD